MPETGPCDCPGCPNIFSSKAAEDGLRRYRRNGPDPTTKTLIDAIVAEGIGGRTVLDIGGGIGAIQLGLLAAGAASTQSVDASPPYTAAAREEAERRGVADRTRYVVGDFVAVAAAVEPADVVTLDRMVCCYSDMPALVDRAVAHAHAMIGLVYPRDAGWTRAVATVLNGLERLLRRPMRWHIHPESDLDRRIRQAGFERRFLRRNVLWQVARYVRPAA
jgi:2-polyprenyl-3-methyl-5-hydroxy-6-metoxy-1,4-benzoquinol methylase